VILYIDTSSLVKLFLRETGDTLVEALLDNAARVMCSVLTYAEARSALSRARQASRLNDAAYQQALASLESQWTTFTTRPVDDGLARYAGDLAEKHLLRGFDAVHLASALSLQDDLGSPVTFSAWDERLMTAAAAEGLTPGHAVP
jgi:predicted nucleic acid-binding protein